ncbi:DUF3725 domain-containing protein [Listeria aquatica]|uniref:DUF3725 domain-containing protein n=1 Tax=Listeria aquatica TaxID=1494960 RepID=UPI003EF306DB
MKRTLEEQQEKQRRKERRQKEERAARQAAFQAWKHHLKQREFWKIWGMNLGRVIQRGCQLFMAIFSLWLFYGLCASIGIWAQEKFQQEGLSNVPIVSIFKGLFVWGLVSCLAYSLFLLMLEKKRLIKRLFRLFANRMLTICLFLAFVFQMDLPFNTFQQDLLMTWLVGQLVLFLIYGGMKGAETLLQYDLFRLQHRHFYYRKEPIEFLQEEPNHFVFLEERWRPYAEVCFVQISQSQELMQHQPLIIQSNEWEEVPVHQRWVHLEIQIRLKQSLLSPFTWKQAGLLLDKRNQICFWREDSFIDKWRKGRKITSIKKRFLRLWYNHKEITGRQFLELNQDRFRNVEEIKQTMISQNYYETKNRFWVTHDGLGFLVETSMYKKAENKE